MVSPTTGNAATGTAYAGTSGVVTTTSGATCTVNPVSLSGIYSCVLFPTPLDGEDATVVSADVAGNSTSITVSNAIDITAPVAPTINTPTNGNPAEGLAEPGTTVVVSTPSGATCTTIATPLGTFSCVLSPLPNDGEDITATSTDFAGNSSSTTIPNAIAGVDHDGDGVIDAQELLAINSGDGNDDGILDMMQSDVASIISPVDTNPVTLEVIGVNCQLVSGFSIIPETSNANLDSNFYYPLGLNDFQLSCTSPGTTTTVRVIYSSVHDTSLWQYRKYDRNLTSYSDMSSAVTYATASIGINSVTTASYSISDGGVLDEDALANGTIVDPSGPALSTLPTVTTPPDKTPDIIVPPSGKLPKTGGNTWDLLNEIIAITTLGFGLILIARKRRSKESCKF